MNQIQISPERLSRDYYRFQRYNSKQRMLAYWHQLKLIEECRPATLLEVGVGSGIVTAYLRHQGVSVTTLDINPALRPDHVGSILRPPPALAERRFDVVLCSRVLHHLPFDEFPQALSMLSRLTERHCLLTLPVNDFRLYCLLRLTSTSPFTLSLPLPLALKRVWQRRRGRTSGSGLWQIDASPATSRRRVSAEIGRYFDCLRHYPVPEDRSHMVYLLRPRPATVAAERPVGEDVRCA
ncbi:class I SAM-dependent methyltransferase [Billgrantia antri]|uniref:class I SAM-dependent methyltransferase n=1 Tax=Billgrantia antri TaxID=2846777 RepID=UPI003B20EE96